jgi:hypothetical protein
MHFEESTAAVDSSFLHAPAGNPGFRLIREFRGSFF